MSLMLRAFPNNLPLALSQQMCHVTHPHRLYMPLKASSHQSLSKGISDVVLGRDLTYIHLSCLHMPSNNVIPPIDVLGPLVVPRFPCVGNSPCIITVKCDRLVNTRNNLKVSKELAELNRFYRCLSHSHIL